MNDNKELIAILGVIWCCVFFFFKWTSLFLLEIQTEICIDESRWCLGLLQDKIEGLGENEGYILSKICHGCVNNYGSYVRSTLKFDNTVMSPFVYAWNFSCQKYKHILAI